MARPQHLAAGGAKASEEGYREALAFDRWGWGSHCVDCYPSNCPYRVYVKDGVIVREEQAATFPVIEAGVPDMNPMGCQKGGSWSRLLYGGERIFHPMRRAGERGEGKWKQISWDEALTEIAENMLNTIQSDGPESIVRIGTPGQGGTQSIALAGAVFNKLGCTMTDVQGEINDWSPGIYVTFGRFDPCASSDDWFHSDVLVIWATTRLQPDRAVHPGGALPRGASRCRRPRLQPVGHPRRHVRPRAHRQRCGARARNVPRDHR
jgi:anaerobic selenocysteine-containing dehydrogenase